MPRTPTRHIGHGDEDDFHETVDAFDSHSRIIGEARSDQFWPDPTEAEVDEHRAELAARAARKRPVGFTADWPGVTGGESR